MIAYNFFFRKLQICYFIHVSKFFSQMPVFNIILVRDYVKIATHSPRLPRRGRGSAYKLSFYCSRLRCRPQTKSLLFIR